MKLVIILTAIQECDCGTLELPSHNLRIPIWCDEHEPPNQRRCTSRNEHYYRCTAWGEHSEHTYE